MPLTASFTLALGLVLLVGCAERQAAQELAAPAQAAGSSGMQPVAAGDAAEPMPAADAQAIPDIADAQEIPDTGPTPPIDAGPAPSEDDAGDWMPPDPVCTDGAWRLAPGFLLARPVDYVADRETRMVDGVLEDKSVLWSEAGMACANALRHEDCRAALQARGAFGRHLVTTSGDRVQLWNARVAQQVLGLIDTPAEAIWQLLALSGYFVPCDATVEANPDGYLISGALSPVCGDTVNWMHRPLRVLVQPSGTYNDLGPVGMDGPICAPR